MVGHCRDCRWWKLDHPTDDSGTCERASVGTDLSYDDEGSLCHAIAYWHCDSGADLHTKPDFGCVQFEAKERRGAFSVPVDAWVFMPDGEKLAVQQVVGDGFVLKEDRDIAPGTPVILVVSPQGQSTTVRRLIVGEQQSGPVVVTEDDGEPQ